MLAGHLDQLAELWFDVEKRYKTILCLEQKPRAGCGLM